jgi:hypothetical protein
MHFQIDWATARGVRIIPVKVTIFWPQQHIGIFVVGLNYIDVKEDQVGVKSKYRICNAKENMCRMCMLAAYLTIYS